MPPSPALRCSPGRERKLDSKHKRGHSFESGLTLKAKDDDLILFNEMKMREDNFLLHSNEDFDDTLSKLKCISDFKLGIKVPGHGENSDLLNADDEKNDYDWLLTPPDTPLFPSLDDEEPPPSNLITRGRQSQPGSISKPSMAERNQRLNKTSAGPRRRSPSPLPGGSAHQLRGRASSVPRTSQAPILRSTTPSKRPCTPPNKSSTPTPRSITPTLRRTSSGLTLSSGRGSSPSKGSRGSSSPKLRGWQSNAPGFSSDAPPNLRTSISDRPTSYSRGSSPASRNTKEIKSRYNRQSVSPTASRSVSSSQSHDNDRFSPRSKGSMMSSGDDDIVSVQSLNVGIPVSQTGKKSEVFVNGRITAFPKKTSRTPSPSSVPKRSFDSALRQMDHRRTQNMFRPLMSSVPPSSFYNGKASAPHRPMFSRNSSLTTTSNASSEQGAGISPDTGCNDQDHAALTGDWEKTPEHGMQGEIFIFDKTEDINKDSKLECCATQFSIDDSIAGGMQKMLEPENKDSTCDPSHVVSDTCERTATCSVCGKSFQTAEVSGNADVCLGCAVDNDLFSVTLNKTAPLSCQEEDTQNKMTDASGNLCNIPQSNLDVIEFQETDSNTDLLFQLVTKPNPITETIQDDHMVQLEMMKKEENIGKRSDLQKTIDSIQLISDYKVLHSQSFSPSSRIDVAEGTGISVQSRRSFTGKGPVVHGRISTASNIQHAEPPYARENASSIRLNDSYNSSAASSSFDFDSSKGSVVQGRLASSSNTQCTETSSARENLSTIKLDHSRNSSTASSSLDMGSSRPMEAHVQYQLSIRKDCAEFLGKDPSLNTQNSLDSLTRNTSIEFVGQSHKTKGCSDHTDFCDPGEIPCCRPPEYIDCSDAPSSSNETVATEENSCTKSFGIRDVLISAISDFSQGLHLAESSLADAQISDRSNMHDNSELNQSKERNIADMEGPVGIASNIGEESESRTIDNGAYESIETSGIMLEVHDDCERSENSQLDCKKLQNSNDDREAYSFPSVTVITDEGQSVSQPEPIHGNHTERIHDKSTVIVESSSGRKSRSLTLEEVTDTILFCSSIIHDLAYKAASIGLEKEQSSVPNADVSRPTVITLEGPVSHQNNQSKSLRRRPNKSQKLRKLETVEVLSNDLVNDAKVEELYTTDLPRKLETTKAPKIEAKCNCIVM